MTELGFGTAGLRGRMGEGPGMFNTALVARVSAALAQYLRERYPFEATVLVGYDARHHSAEFALEAAAVLGGAGAHARTFAGPLPTPVLAFAVRHQRACAGVMITASHNPAADNGYKIYLADGAQLAPPVDAEIEALLAAVPASGDLPRDFGRSTVPDSVVEAYLDRAVTLLSPEGPRDLRVVHTSLHGVAAETFRRAWTRAGFPPAHEVAEQAEPDPDFPTVAFPNPEEPGALDLACARALEVGADLVLANDPDGDRCAVMIPEPDGADRVTGFRALTGDEVGALLAIHLLERGRIPADGVLASTIVSSPMLARLATEHGREHVETLTGFKWLARVPRLAYAYEEALGYCTDPDAVRDKDGITAALLIAELAALARTTGTGLSDCLDTLHRRHGLDATAARSVRTPDPAAAARALADLLRDPPSALAGIRVDTVEDLQASPDLPPTPGVRLRAGRLRAVVRPSGTEPKLKIYLHAALGPPVPDLRESRADLSALLARAGKELSGQLAETAGE